MKAVTGHFSVH